MSIDEPTPDVAGTSPGIFQRYRRTWIVAAIGLMVLISVLVWGTMAQVLWSFGKLGAQPQDVGPVTQTRQSQRDVTGTDIGPVPRYPGFARTYWHREGKHLTVEYEGKADYSAVLDAYTRGFAGRGYTQTVQPMTEGAAMHEYAKDGNSYSLMISRVQKDGVSVRIKTTLP